MTARRWGCSIAAGIVLGLAWVAAVIGIALRHDEEYLL